MRQNLSAKITVIVYILICFEVGLMLLILPWTRYWDDNFFLYFVTGKLNSPGLLSFLTSGWVRGAVTGLGIVNLLAGLRDLFKFRESVYLLSGHQIYPAVSSSADAIASDSSVNLPDHRPPSIPPQV
ncbi:MAG: hypothetical protein HYR56_07645 [Acidobacteria bacterium]|nr:hypothetical protein [Acidobacteriota bacterium]MBI3427362.1 hypothetical protein [Acidobacteriota bacterium]